MAAPPQPSAAAASPAPPPPLLLLLPPPPPPPPPTPTPTPLPLNQLVPCIPVVENYMVSPALTFFTYSLLFSSHARPFFTFLLIMPHNANLQLQNSKASFQASVAEAAEPIPPHRPLFLINSGDCCLTASDSRAGDAARADARKVSGWSSSIQHPYRPLGVVAPIIFPISCKKKGNGVRNGHANLAFAAPQPPSQLAAPSEHVHPVPRPPPLQLPLHKVLRQDDGSASARSGNGSVSSRRRLVDADASQCDATALDSFRCVRNSSALHF